MGGNIVVLSYHCIPSEDFPSPQLQKITQVSMTEPSEQLDLKSGMICQRTSDNRTCHIAISDSRWMRFLISVKHPLTGL